MDKEMVIQGEYMEKERTKNRGVICKLVSHVGQYAINGRSKCQTLKLKGEGTNLF